MRKEISKNFILIIFICAFFFMIKSLFASTEYAMQDKSIISHFIYLSLGIIAWSCGQIMLINKKEVFLFKQLALLDVIIAILFSALTVKGRIELYNMGREKYVYSYYEIIVGCLVPIVYGMLKGNVWNGRELKIKSWFLKHKWIMLLELFIFTMAICQAGSEPRWDGAYLFKFMKQISLPNIYNIRSLSFCGHISMSFIAVNEILAVLLGNLKLGMTAGTIILLVSSVASFYGITKELLIGKSDFEYALLSSCWAVSPFVLGMAGYNYWDQWLIMLFPSVIYFAMRKQWGYHLTLAFFMCFIKETAIVAYAGYCVGLVIWDLLVQRDWKLILKQRKYWCMLAIGMAWLYVYIVLPNWDGVGSFTFNLGYILNKAKVLFILNFNWILVIFSMIGLISIFLKKNDMLENIAPLLISDVIFILFSWLFQTVNHARYIDSHVVILYIFAIIGISTFKNNMFYGITGIIICALFISNYETLDPFTKLVFKKYNVGETNMISTCDDELLSDSMVYNQQYRFFDKALNLSLEDAVYDDSLVCFPQIQMRSWFFDGIYANAEVDETKIQFWNTKNNKRVLDSDDFSIPFRVCNITSESDIDKILGNKVGYFFFIPCAGADVADMLRSKTNVVEEKEFGYRGWKVTRIKFVLQ